jgi:hypothetical protein
VAPSGPGYKVQIRSKNDRAFNAEVSYTGVVVLPEKCIDPSDGTTPWILS